MATLPAGTVTFVFSDVDSSTDLLKRVGEDCATLKDIGEPERVFELAIEGSRSRRALERSLRNLGKRR